MFLWKPWVTKSCSNRIKVTFSNLITWYSWAKSKKPRAGIQLRITNKYRNNRTFYVTSLLSNIYFYNLKNWPLLTADWPERLTQNRTVHLFEKAMRFASLESVKSMSFQKITEYWTSKITKQIGRYVDVASSFLEKNLKCGI